jgi:hypothetical protein
VLLRAVISEYVIVELPNAAQAPSKVHTTIVHMMLRSTGFFSGVFTGTKRIDSLLTASQTIADLAGIVRRRLDRVVAAQASFHTSLTPGSLGNPK